jgi:hypothetical protein
MSCANIIARMPLPHILVSVTAPALSGRPARRIAWRAGAWPWPAIRQLPSSTSSTASPGTPARSTAAFTATAPSSQAASGEIAQQAADGRAGGGDDDDGIGHGEAPSGAGVGQCDVDRPPFSAATRLM